MRLLTLTSLALAAVVQAQNQTVSVQVGGTTSEAGGIFQFKPNSFSAKNGSVITFEFSGNPGNHSITQSNFTVPCEPMEGGFDSGWVLIPQGGVSPNPTWNLTITNDQKPIWFFCKQLIPAPHCAAGMIGAINAPSSGANTFENYQNNAKAFKGNSGQGIGALEGIGASASAPPGPIPSGASLFGTPDATAPGGVSASASASSSGSTTSTSSSAGTMMKYDSLLALLAGVMGIVLV